MFRPFVMPLITGFDPATLSLTSWERASYSGAPWTGTASAGTSGSHQLSAGTAPSMGTAVNGLTPASCNGTTQFLIDSGNALSTYVTSSAYSLIVLTKPSAPAAPSGTVYVDAQIISGTDPTHATMGIGWSTSGVQAWHYDGASLVATGWLAASSGSWAMVSATYDGSTLAIRVNNGSPTSVSAANVDSSSMAASFLKFGTNYNSSVFTAEDVLEVMVAGADLTSSLANIKSYFNSRYGLSL